METTVDLGCRASGTEIGDYCIIWGHVGGPPDPSLDSLLTAPSPPPLAYGAFHAFVWSCFYGVAAMLGFHFQSLQSQEAHSLLKPQALSPQV